MCQTSRHVSDPNQYMSLQPLAFRIRKLDALSCQPIFRLNLHPPTKAAGRIPILLNHVIKTRQKNTVMGKVLRFMVKAHSTTPAAMNMYCHLLVFRSIVLLHSLGHIAVAFTTKPYLSYQIHKHMYVCLHECAESLDLTPPYHENSASQSMTSTTP